MSLLHASLPWIFPSQVPRVNLVSSSKRWLILDQNVLHFLFRELSIHYLMWHLHSLWNRRAVWILRFLFWINDRIFCFICLCARLSQKVRWLAHLFSRPLFEFFASLGNVWIIIILFSKWIIVTWETEDDILMGCYLYAESLIYSERETTKISPLWSEKTMMYSWVATYIQSP